MTESQAMQSWHHGAHQAFRHLVDRYRDALHRNATLMTGIETQAKARLREPLQAAACRVQPAEPGARVTSWLMRSRIRHEPTTPADSSSPSDRSQHQGPAWIPPSPPEPDAGDLRRQQIRSALRALAPAFRHLLILCYFANLTVRQISIEFGEAEDDVESRRREALSQLRRRLQAISGSPGGGLGFFDSDRELVDALRDYFSTAKATLPDPDDLWDALKSRGPEPSCVDRIRRTIAGAWRFWTPLAATGGSAALTSAVLCAATA